jgi:lipopolysaccharide biosynthesis regulator YciM
LKLAQLYAGALHDSDKAMEWAKKAREQAPNDSRTAGILGRIAFQAGNLSWSYSLLQESARRAGDDPAVLHDLAMAAYGLGKVTEARQTMQRAVNAKLDAAAADDAKRFLAMTSLDQLSAETVAAEPEIQKTLQTEPDYVPALMAEAAVKLQGNDTKAATDLYSKVLQKYPDFAPAEKRLAAIYAENPDDVSKAYDLAMKARKTLADDPELAQTLAEISYARKDFPYAIQLFQQSSAKRPLSAKDLYFLGAAQMQTKQEAKGRENLEKALAAGLKDPMAQDAKRRLTPLQQPK